MYKLVIYPEVYQDIAEIREYITSRDGAERGHDIAQSILSAIESLSELPNRGARLRNKNPNWNEHRFLIVKKNFAIIYCIKGEDVHITVVRHMSRDLFICSSC